MPARRIPKNYRSVTGLVASNDESDQVTAYESSLERDCIKHVIFNKNVARHEEQPVTIPFICDGKHYSYTPDLLITYRGDVAPAKEWKPLLAEIKYRSDLFKDRLKLKPKFRAARRYAIAMAWDFTIITDSEIRTPYLKNITLLLECRKHPTDGGVTKLLLEALNSLGKTNPDTLLRSVSEEPLNRARLIPTLWQLIADYRIGAGSLILAFRAPCVPGMMSPRSGSFNKSSSMAKSTFIDARPSICLMNTGVSRKF